MSRGAVCVDPTLFLQFTAIRGYVPLGSANMVYGPDGIVPAELARLGVARISVGPFVFYLLQKRLEVALVALRRGDDKGTWS